MPDDECYLQNDENTLCHEVDIVKLDYIEDMPVYPMFYIYYPD